MPGLLSNIKHHLPRIRLTDSLIGSGLGAGLGAGAYGLRRLAGADEEDVSLGSHMLGGGLLGFGAGNLLGDRTRRYIANNAVPASYGDASGRFIAPQSAKQVWDTAVLDKPNEAILPHVQDAQKATGAYPDLSPFVLKARQELLRRGMGLPVRQGSQIFRSRGSQPFSPTPGTPNPADTSRPLSPGSGGIEGDYETVEFDPKAWSKAVKDKDPGVLKMQGLLGDRFAWEKARSRGENVDPLFPWGGTASPFGPLMASHGTQTDVKQQTADVSDLWDFGLTPGENDQVGKYISSPSTLSQDAPDYAKRTDPWKGDWHGGGLAQSGEKSTSIPDPEQPAAGNVDWRQPTGLEHLGELAKRKLLNLLLLHRGGVAVKQKFDMSKPSPSPLWEKQQNDMSYELGRQASTLIDGT